MNKTFEITLINNSKNPTPLLNKIDILNEALGEQLNFADVDLDIRTNTKEKKYTLLITINGWDKYFNIIDEDEEVDTADYIKMVQDDINTLININNITKDFGVYVYVYDNPQYLQYLVKQLTDLMNNKIIL